MGVPAAPCWSGRGSSRSWGPFRQGNRQQGHFNGQQLKKDFLSWVRKQLLLYSLYFSIWENQVWGRRYNSNLKSKVTGLYTLQQKWGSKGVGGECLQPAIWRDPLKKKAIKIYKNPLVFLQAQPQANAHEARKERETPALMCLSPAKKICSGQYAQTKGRRTRTM